MINYWSNEKWVPLLIRPYCFAEMSGLVLKDSFLSFGINRGFGGFSLEGRTVMEFYGKLVIRELVWNDKNPGL